MKPKRLSTKKQATAYSSPWTTREKLGMAAWRLVCLLLFRPTPKSWKGWRIGLLRLFGARLSGRPFISPSARIRIPWNLEMEDHACLGEGVEVYNLGVVRLKARCTVAQHSYLCAGTHDISTPRLPLIVGEIEIGEDVFIGAAAFVLPGVRIGNGAVIGARAVVTKDMPEWTICAGNPCKPIKPRPWNPTG
jgi:putative colanic acid biosynthesis acetyltransferase WcaF